MASPFSPEWLIDYSGEHLLHELSMLWETAHALGQHKQGSTEYTALLESFATHLRNLIEFFFFAEKSEYVRAKHFFDDPTAWSPQMTAYWERLHERASNEVSHLTVRRINGSPPEKDWDISTTLSQVENMAREFAAKASTAKLHPKVREFLQQSAEKMVGWIGSNVSHSNVASGIVSFGANSASTSTQLIDVIEIKP